MSSRGSSSARPSGSDTSFASRAWAAIESSAGGSEPIRFDPGTIDTLPAPARRYLVNALPAGVALATMVELEMRGEIMLGRHWFPFTAAQILRPSVGLVWSAVVGGKFLRFRGADSLANGEATMEFRLHGVIPVVRATGDDVKRSAQGRLAAETVAWLPQQLTPQAGARWRGIDDERAVVTIPAAGTDVDVEVAVAPDGRLSWMTLQRWSDTTDPPGYRTFGGTVGTTLTTPDGIGIAGSGAVGWDWQADRPDEGVFFRYQVTHAVFGGSPVP